jgi:hypothetical protein
MHPTSYSSIDLLVSLFSWVIYLRTELTETLIYALYMAAITSKTRKVAIFSITDLQTE